ncbi:phage tail assembly protein [Azospirillum sp. TSH64]|uniref:phage tail assembly protein n=1 Tax=Azospirillum sp. TSH64 TaxID=652740 RepID=UPI000D621BE7|nr:phage tail assembly protein [Azospirillum sp. TSH64]PWC81243.1 hypothetical protein TSH64_00945 [Azospirillum sp. TSH64]
MDKRRFADIELDFPVEINGTKVRAVRMRRPTVRDELAFQDAKGSAAKKAVDLLASLCELAPNDLLGMDAADFSKLEAQYGAFRGASPSKSSGEPS